MVYAVSTKEKIVVIKNDFTLEEFNELFNNERFEEYTFRQMVKEKPVKESSKSIFPNLWSFKTVKL